MYVVVESDGHLPAECDRMLDAEERNGVTMPVSPRTVSLNSIYR